MCKIFVLTGKLEAAKSMTDIDEIEREIRALSLEYMRELPERFQFLINEVAQIKAGAADPSVAKGEAHKIKGTASSYGAYEIGEQAVIIDDCLKQITKNPQDVSAELWLRLEAALNEAARLAGEAVAGIDAESAV